MLSLQQHQELPQVENEEPGGSKSEETSFCVNSDYSSCKDGESLKHGSMEGGPEEAFELSLRDLVELQKVVSSMEENQIAKGGGDLFQHKPRNWEERKKVVEVSKKWNSGRMDIRVGLFKWLFPAPFGLGGSRSRANRRMKERVDGERPKNIYSGVLKRNHNADTDGSMHRRTGSCSFFFNTRKTKARKN